jgi:glycerol kinase
MPAPAILAIDQGTTSSRAIAFDLDGRIVALAQEEFAQIYPRPGWVEHDPEVIWATALSTARKAFSEAEAKGFTVAAIGIANQRETTLVWERATGRPIHNAIVWQDRRTAEACADLERDGAGPLVAERAGLVLDPYFSASKIGWILDQTGARGRAEAGELAFGTVESWLIWRLTGGRRHVCDATNASRTSLYALAAQDWDEDLMALFAIPRPMLPEIADNAGLFGETDRDVFGRAVPVTGAAGDQQAAAIGQACLKPGEMKSTYGTGAFMILNTGSEVVASQNRLLSTTAWRLDGVSAFALEGSVLSAGAAVQWLRDGLGIIGKSSEVEALAESADPESGVYLVPAFTGLGAPHWRPEARAALYGMSRGTGRAEIARAALDSVCWQTADLLRAMHADGARVAELRIDGGMAANTAFARRMADLCGVTVTRPVNTETTAWGAAFLAGLGAGLFGGLEDAARLWDAADRFEPQMDEARRARLEAGWAEAIRRTLA